MMTRRQLVAAYFDSADVARFDALIPMLSTYFWQATRSDVLRAAIRRSLDLFERDHEAAKRELAIVREAKSAKR